MLELIGMLPEFEDDYGDKDYKSRAKSNIEIRALAKPINIFLQEQSKFSGPPLKPRGYQIELYQKALDGNKIIYLGTGLGKTFIVVMLLKSDYISNLISDGKRIIFLAPTQDLVRQQAEYIHRHLPLNVKVYCGRTSNSGLHIDFWDAKVWEQEISMYEVLFMTPAILNQALAINAIKWDMIALLIFDEVHHAATTKKEKTGKSGGHPYSQILKHHINTRSQSVWKPKFTGLTASLINDMPSSPEHIRLSVKDLEQKLMADCITDLSAIETKPAHVIWSFLGASNPYDPIKSLLLEYAKRYEAALEISELNAMKILGPETEDQKKILAFHNRLRLAASGFSIKPSSFHKILKQLAGLRERSGLYVLAYICYNLSRSMAEHSKFSPLHKSVRPVYTEFGNILLKITIAIDALINTDRQSLLLSYSEPKLICLLEVLKTEYSKVQNNRDSKETFSCIVFVKSRIEVKAICGWLHMVSKYIDGYDFVKVDYAIGLSATVASKWACITRRKSTEQSATLENFRKGLLNVIVTTSVLEEGIDLPVCSTVIRYDNPDTFRVYVQSRGRARQKNSTYIYMTPEAKIKDAQDALNKYNDFEYRVKEILSSKDVSSQSAISSSSVVNGDQGENYRDYFRDPVNEIYISDSVARVILQKYCDRLKRRCPYSDGLQFRRRRISQFYQTTLCFPANCPVKDIVIGNPKRTVELADSSAVIAAFKSLYKAGELDKNGVPLKMTEEHIDEVLSEFNLKPVFSPLSEQLEGRVVKRDGKDTHVYPWKLFRLTFSSLARAFFDKHYQLLQIDLKVENDESARRDTRRYFEKPVFGLILDSSIDIANLPRKIWSHYGEFTVNYQLIDRDLPLREHSLHQSLSNYTYRLITTFWNLPQMHKLSFSERCIFYIVPLNQSKKIDKSQIRQDFFPDSSSIRAGDVVRINHLHQTRDNRTQKFIVEEVITDMDSTSLIPGSRETFYERMVSHGFAVHDSSQPVVAVRPISRDFGRSSKGKTVRSEDSTRVVHYLWQCLERIHCNIYEAYQACILPEIVYQVFLNALASDLEKNFKDKTVEFREAHEATRHTQQMEMEVEEHDDIIIDTHNDEPDEYNGCFDEQFLDDGDMINSETSSESDSESGSDTSSDSDEPKPRNRLLDILARQEFELLEKDKSHMEKWDLSQYELNDIRTMETDLINSFHQPRPPLGDSIDSLRDETIRHQANIEEVLRNFRQGFLGDTDFNDDADDLLRLDRRVDRTIEPPISFDRNSKPMGVPLKTAFIEAITLRRANQFTNLEALENIGDSYLKYCISVILFKYVGHNEGLLTYARSRLVGNKYLFHLAKQSKLGEYAIMNKFDREVLGAALGAKPTCENRLRPKDMADMVESLIGACLVHGGQYEAVLALRWLGLGHIFREDTFREIHKDMVTFAAPSESPLDSDDKQAAEILGAHRRELRKLQMNLGFEFNDEAYLLQAITHGSALNRCTESYERLEFLGDAILDFLITMTLYNAGFTKDPGQITATRSALVNNSTFAKLAINYGFDRFLFHGNQEIHEELARINELIKTETDLNFLGQIEFDRISKTLADVFEAVAGAIYLDSGCSLDCVYQTYYPMMKDVIDKEIENPSKNVISQLYETFPGEGRIKFEYLKTNLNEQEIVTCAKCTVYGIDQVFLGQGLNNRHAKIRAATSVMENLPDPEEKANLDKQWAELEAGKQPRRRPGFSGDHRGEFSRGSRGDRGRGRGGGVRGGYRPGYHRRNHTMRYRRY